MTARAKIADSRRQRLAHPVPPEEMEVSTRKLILDTDPGVDDAMALLFLKSQPTLSLLGITTVFGNADVDITTRNALYLTQRFGIDAPVFAGAGKPLVRGQRPSSHHIHGHDALGDAGVTAKFRGQPQGVAAAEAIVDMIRRNPHEVTILAVAPLTNLAQALTLDPGIAELTRQVVIMGGAFGGGRARGNATPVAEANIFSDPHAADQVVTAPWPVTMVGLDVTTQCVLTSARAARLAEHGGEYGRFLWDISRGYESIYRAQGAYEGCCLHDVAAAVYLIAPGLFDVARGPIRVVTEGIAMGQTLQKPAEQYFPPSAWDDHPPQQVCTAVDAQGLLSLYEDGLERLAKPAR